MRCHYVFVTLQIREVCSRRELETCWTAPVARGQFLGVKLWLDHSCSSQKSRAQHSSPPMRLDIISEKVILKHNENTMEVMKRCVSPSSIQKAKTHYTWQSHTEIERQQLSRNEAECSIQFDLKINRHFVIGHSLCVEEAALTYFCGSSSGLDPWLRLS